MPQGFVVGRQVLEFLECRNPSLLFLQPIGIGPAQFFHKPARPVCCFEAMLPPVRRIRFCFRSHRHGQPRPRPLERQSQFPMQPG